MKAEKRVYQVRGVLPKGVEYPEGIGTDVSDYMKRTDFIRNIQIGVVAEDAATALSKAQDKFPGMRIDCVNQNGFIHIE